MRLQKTARGGFTLIELLVVIGLILVLVGITVSISYSGLIDSHKTVGAGDRASGWLLIARSKAQREQAPRGVRFILNGTLIKEAQYIEVPDPFVPRTVDPNAQLLVLHNYNSVTMVTTFLMPSSIVCRTSGPAFFNGPSSMTSIGGNIDSA